MHAKDKLVRSPGENGGGQDAQKDLHPRTGRDETKGKTQERMERGRRNRSSSAGSETVAYPGIFFRGGSTNSVENREKGDLGAVAS